MKEDKPCFEGVPGEELLTHQGNGKERSEVDGSQQGITGRPSPEGAILENPQVQKGVSGGELPNHKEGQEESSGKGRDPNGRRGEPVIALTVFQGELNAGDGSHKKKNSRKVKRFIRNGMMGVGNIAIGEVGEKDSCGYVDEENPRP